MPIKDAQDLKPIYLPFETLANYVGRLKATGVPSRIDASIRPHSMAGGTHTLIISSLRYLNLVDSAGTPNERLKDLVKAHGTEGWGNCLSEVVFQKYGEILGDLDIDNATPHQLEEAFEAAGVSGQVRDKAIRFFLNCLTAAGLPISPHLASRKKRRNNVSLKNGKKTTKKKTGKKSPSKKHQQPEKEDTSTQLPEGSDFLPVPLGTGRKGSIVYPTDVTEDECDKFSAAIDYLRQLVK